MTNYLTSVGVQQVSITIASGQTTGTAAITAVGSGAFLVYQGQTTTDSTTAVSAQAQVTLTNSTTVTATRNTASTDTITINAAVVDGNTTNLINSVQFGTVTIATAATTGTASISAVTNANAAVLYLGSSTTSAFTLTRDFAGLTLSGTTVTATRGLSSGATTVSFCVVEFKGTALNSAVQNVVVASSASVASSTATISSVTTANTMLAYSGVVATASTSSPSRDFAYGTLTNSTTVTMTSATTPGVTTNTYNCCVVEFVSGVLAQNVQRGTIALSSATSNTATITSSALTSTLCNWLGNSSTQTTASDNTTVYNITQTNATTLTMSVNTAASGTGSYEAIQFQPYSTPQTGDALWFGMTF